VDVQAVAAIRFQEIVAIPGAANRAGFAVSVGQVLDGRVSEIDRDTALLQIGQHRVMARTSGSSLSVGDLVRLQVESMSPDQVIMRLVARGDGGVLRRTLTDPDLAAHLRGGGLDPDCTALAIARALVARGAPLTAGAVLRVRAAVVVTRSDDADDLQTRSAEIDAAAYLEARGSPVSRASIDIARRALASRETLGNRVAEFRAALTDLADELVRLESGGHPIPLSRDRVDPAQTRSAAPRDQAPPFEDNPGDPHRQAHSERGAQLPTALTARAAIEHARAPSPDSGSSSHSPAPRPLSTLVREMLAHLPSDEAFQGSDDAVASVLREVIAEHGTPVETKLARLLLREGSVGEPRLEQDLRAALGRVIDDTMTASAVARQIPSLQALADGLARVADLGSQIQAQIEFGQLANAAPRADAGQPPYLVFQIPIGQRGTSESVEIRIRQEASGAARVDPENTHLIFNFDLADLGPLRVGLMVHRQLISCQISAGSPDIRDMLGDRTTELRAGLAGLGYAVDPVRCDLLGSPPGQAHPKVSEPPPGPVSRLDARI